jgi:hsp70-interacting protein
LIQYLAHTPIPTILSFLSPSTPAKTRAKAVYALSGLLKHSASGISQFNSADGWPVLRSALEDSDINVRRKTAFLLNTLLVPSSPVDALPSQTQASGSTSGSTSTTLHHESQNANQGPVHANTHASMVSDPKSVDTSTATLAAFRDQGILKALVDGLTHPLPYGPDGDTESDVDFEEKVVGYALPFTYPWAPSDLYYSALSTYVLACRGVFAHEEKVAFKKYLEQDKSGERWGLSADELRALHTAL